ncbi:MAG: class I SAM-dependent methyltransferase, partial [Nanoarchaeota archaeon]|nr:class I SAM-dependent methyltransferase [Nanoarchaeota archaeon]
MKNLELMTKYSTGKPFWESHSPYYQPDFIEELSQLPEGPVLDAGCSAGYDHLGLQDITKREIIGIDTNPKAIEEAIKKSPTGTFFRRDIQDTSFKDETFAAVYMINVAHYLDDQAKALNEMYRVLKTGGYLYIHFNTEIIDNEGNIDYQQSEEEISDLIENSKFQVVSKKNFTRSDQFP